MSINNEQKFCANCGKTKHSKYFETCECRNPNFVFDSYEDYLKARNIKKCIVFKFDNVIYKSNCNNDIDIKIEPSDEIREIINALKDKFKIAIVSDRCAGEFGKIDIMKYLDKYNIHYDTVSRILPDSILYIGGII